MPPKKTQSYILVLESNPKQVIKVEEFLEKINKSIHLDDVKYNKLLVATTEAVNNGIIHGNKRDPQKKVVLSCEAADPVLIVRVHDEGPGVDPSTLPDPLAVENLLRENGRGVFLMRSLMDTVEFTTDSTGSEVIMTITM